MSTHTTLITNYIISGFTIACFLVWILDILKIKRSFFESKSTTAVFVFAFACLIQFLFITIPITAEIIYSLRSGYEYESFLFANRAWGPYSWAYWGMILSQYLGFVCSQMLWSKKYRFNKAILLLSIIFIGQISFFEKFMILITSLHRDFLVSSWALSSGSEWIIDLIISAFVFATIVYILEYFRNYFKTKNDLPNKA